ncbi:hypothetical protein ACFOUV_02625 [Oceanobacillus longus]|uniref:Uncharacterized protein n=1 Tax=Oceanobacillus longus TaxID=930120 RepID=A0ABV8GXE3_9BACI
MANDILKRLQALQKEKETNDTLKKLAVLENKLYEMDVDAMTYEVDKGYRTQESADKELERRRNKYFG